MDTTVALLLLTQSPALFLAFLVLLVCFFLRRKAHRIRAFLDLIAALACLVGGVVLYYLGMLHGHFTIHDFWHIRIPGWIGLAAVVVLTGLTAYRSTARFIQKRRAEKAAGRAEAARLQELEDAKTAAYASGRADALAVEKVASTVAQATGSTADAAAAASEEQAAQ